MQHKLWCGAQQIPPPAANDSDLLTPQSWCERTDMTEVDWSTATTLLADTVTNTSRTLHINR